MGLKGLNSHVAATWLSSQLAAATACLHTAGLQAQGPAAAGMRHCHSTPAQQSDRAANGRHLVEQGLAMWGLQKAGRHLVLQQLHCRAVPAQPYPRE